MFSDLILPRITKVTQQGTMGRYEIGPLEPGYGITVVQALKRILLTSLPGAAVTAIRIEGVTKGSQEIAAVKEDLIEVILNVKHLRFRCFVDHPVSIVLNVTGTSTVRAADLQVPETIEVINPEAHLATLKHVYASLKGELIVQQGRGYVPAERQSTPPGFLAIDAIYSPVRTVHATIEHTRVGKMVNFEKVLLDVETDATMTSDEALRQSSEILSQQFLALMPSQHRERRNVSQSAVCIPPHIDDLPLEQLGLSIRSYNALKRYGNVTKVGHILVLDEAGLRNIRNVGDKVLMDIWSHLQAMGCLPLSDHVDSPQSASAITSYTNDHFRDPSEDD
jgi:DNA-directed RNA polymerase subunit alpha